VHVLYLVGTLWVTYCDYGFNYCRFECGAYQAPGSDIFSSRPIFSEVKPVDSSSGDCESFCLRTIINWLERLLTVLDCYSWIFGQNLIPPSQLLIGSLMSQHMEGDMWIYFISVC